MKIEKNVRAINLVFEKINKSSVKFLDNAGIKCPSGCGECCLGKNIAASPLEFLPYSYHLFQEGILEDKYWAMKNNLPQYCVLLNYDEETKSGHCSEYQRRGAICRLFGNAAMVGKDEKKSFSGCKILKAQIDDEIKFNISVQKYAPVYSNFYMQLESIDLEYGSLLLPINEAIMKSMEIVFYSTRE
jgi:uncharacterized protein